MPLYCFFNWPIFLGRLEEFLGRFSTGYCRFPALTSVDGWASSLITEARLVLDKRQSSRIWRILASIWTDFIVIPIVATDSLFHLPFVLFLSLQQIPCSTCY